MKKIINGHLYDTDLAREVANNSEWLGPDKSPTGGRCKVTETLYREIALKPGASLSEARKKTSWGGYTWDDDRIDYGNGAFFLVVGFGWSGNDASAVHPLTEEAARRWFERHHGDDVEKYRRIFGAPTTCLPEYREETRREYELREREDELKSLREQLETVKADRDNLKEKFFKVSGCPLTQTQQPDAELPF